MDWSLFISAQYVLWRATENREPVRHKKGMWLFFSCSKLHLCLQQNKMAKRCDLLGHLSLYCKWLLQQFSWRHCKRKL